LLAGKRTTRRCACSTARSSSTRIAAAYGRAALCYVYAKTNGWFQTANEIAEVTRLAQRAVELGKDDVIALAAGGWALAQVVRDLEPAAALIDRALVLNSNLAEAWFRRLGKNWFRRAGSGDRALARAMRLSPLDPMMGKNARRDRACTFLPGPLRRSGIVGGKWHCRTADFQPGLRIAAAAMQWPDGRSAHKAVGSAAATNPALRVSITKTCWALSACR
jgi:hypothetical protein